MQPTSDYPNFGFPTDLLIHRLLDRPLLWAPQQRIIYRDLGEFTYLQLNDRIHRLGATLTKLGVRPGDRVGILDWDSHRYLECFFAVPMLGAVLHTINGRLSPDQVAYTVRHAGDRLLLVHPDFLPLIRQVKSRLPDVEKIVVMADHPGVAEPAVGDGLPCIGDYEELVEGAATHFHFPEFGENTIATLFYTTGTTGEPKGVYFSHRQIVLHTLTAGLTLSAFREPVSIDGADVYMPLTPMFHVHGWGVPYLATLLGLKQVYPGRYEPAALLQNIARHRVTFSHCVPTILQMLLAQPDTFGVDWPSLKIIIGGAALPKGLAAAAIQRGLRVMGGYGMSETCPIIATSELKPADFDAPESRRLDVLTRTGFPLPLVRTAILDTEGQPLPQGADQVGELGLKAPWLTGGYYRDETRSNELWQGGWLHTGDVAYQDNEGYLRITDRLKDVIKVGGEWISSLELENALSQHPAVREVAVVGVPDAKWGERPHAEVVLREDAPKPPSDRDLMKFLHAFIDRGAIHKRGILTEIHIVPSLPKTSVGKLNKRAIRSALQSPTDTPT
ncbi:MAG: fatty acid--CoA ligase [Verrucomicrobiales bacterium]|nr:fatty acid--CoA ligase [Verrucomicrobiales bacterium]